MEETPFPDYVKPLICLPYRASLVTQMVKTLTGMQETQVRLLGQEDHLEKEMATHSSDLALSPWTEEPGKLQPMGLQRVTIERLSTA